MNSNLQKAYDGLLTKSKELNILQSTTAIVSWDMETKMPPKALNLRSQQMALLELMGHKMLTDPQMGKTLEDIEKAPGYAELDRVQKRNVYLTRKAYDEATKLPESLVFDTAKQQTIAIGVWKKAKAAKDYKMFKPELKKMIELRQKAADILMGVKGTKTPYDALLDDFESNMTADKITKIFDEMRVGLIDVMKRVEKSGYKPDKSILSRPVPIDVQRKISDAAMDYIGYDTKSPNAGGRLDETEHPFTTGYYDDVRITTHYHEDRWVSSLYSVMHEGGHALYDQNLPQRWMYQPIGNASSYGIHESQSRFIENMVGRSPEFLSYMLSRLKKIVGKPLRCVKLADFVAAVNVVEPSKIRIEADEVTYGLHIIIRFEMERDIFMGKLTVEELPQAWNEKYDKYLGVEIENDSEGVMQDTHWASGYYGYFPSYALGNIYGGMFLKKLKKDDPTWKKELKKGNFQPVKNWMIENVHSKGNLYDPADLVKEVTGETLKVKPFISYLEKKFGKIYGF
ncbi:MAG: carboxypeptidase M32 [Candidatus Bathyarchaeota archaeon]|nr:carboxypeptidase M32 [Candidatus Bathyarchaeota archaeon]